jgi:tRNA threonylcarbamoyladenosine biosynthesis protein TsaE
MFERNRVSLEDLGSVASELLCSFPGARIFAFYGEMGSGKTTLIREICKVLRSPDIPNSPSFAIINEYRTADGLFIYHFDFYRIRDLQEAYDLGYEDYFYSDHFCLIEWPEKIGQLLPANHVAVNLNYEAQGTRNIRAECIGEPLK